MLEEVLYFYIADNVLFCDDTQSFTHRDLLYPV